MFFLDQIIKVKFFKRMKKLFFCIAQSKYKFAKHFVNVPKSVFFMMSLHFRNNWVAQKNIFFIILRNLISIISSGKNIGILCSRTLVLACLCSKSQIYTFHFLYISLSTRKNNYSIVRLKGQVEFSNCPSKSLAKYLAQNLS